MKNPRVFFLIFCFGLSMPPAMAQENIFRGNKVGLKVGISQYDTKLTAVTQVGGPLRDTLTLSGHAPVFGMQFEVELPRLTQAYVGVILGVTQGMGYAQSRLDSTIPSTYFRASLLHKIEAALQFGCPYAEVFPFVKVGAVFGEWQIKGHSIGGYDNTKQYRPGVIVGAGVDFKASQKWIWGGAVEYERYKEMKGRYTPSGGGASFSEWTTQPSLMSAYLHFKRKIG